MNKKNKIYLLLGIIIVVLISVIILFSNKEEGDDVIRVGVIAPFSGDLAFYGNALRNGITMAQEDFGLEKYKFIFEDSEYDANKSLSAYQKLVNIDNVDFIIGWGSVTGNVISSLASEDRVPLIYNLAGATINKEDSDNIIIMFNDPKKHIESILSSMDYSDELIYVFLTDNPFLNKVASGLEEFLNVKIFGKYQFSTMDFRTDLIKVSDNAIIVNLLGGPQVLSFYKQMVELGISPKIIIGTDFLEDETLWKKTDSYIKGTIFPAVAIIDEEFIKKYNERFDHDAAIFVAGSYYDLFSEVKELEKENFEEIISILKKREFSGVMGNYSVIESNGLNYMSYPLAIREFTNGTIITKEFLDLE